METDESAVNIDDRMDKLVVGISIEPALEAERFFAESKEQQQKIPLAITAGPATSGTPYDSSQVSALAGKIIKHAYTYLGSFVDSQGKVSIKVFDSWWEKFKTRLQNDPKFLDRQND